MLVTECHPNILSPTSVSKIDVTVRVTKTPQSDINPISHPSPISRWLFYREWHLSCGGKMNVVDEMIGDKPCRQHKQAVTNIKNSSPIAVIFDQSWIMTHDFLLVISIQLWGGGPNMPAISKIFKRPWKWSSWVKIGGIYGPQQIRLQAYVVPIETEIAGTFGPRLNQDCKHIWSPSWPRLQVYLVPNVIKITHCAYSVPMNATFELSFTSGSNKSHFR